MIFDVERRESTPGLFSGSWGVLCMKLYQVPLEAEDDKVSFPT